MRRAVDQNGCAMSAQMTAMMIINAPPRMSALASGYCRAHSSSRSMPRPYRRRSGNRDVAYRGAAGSVSRAVAVISLSVARANRSLPLHPAEQRAVHVHPLRTGLTYHFPSVCVVAMPSLVKPVNRSVRAVFWPEVSDGLLSPSCRRSRRPAAPRRSRRTSASCPWTVIEAHEPSMAIGDLVAVLAQRQLLQADPGGAAGQRGRGQIELRDLHAGVGPSSAPGRAACRRSRGQRRARRARRGPGRCGGRRESSAFTVVADSVLGGRGPDRGDRVAGGGHPVPGRGVRGGVEDARVPAAADLDGGDANRSVVRDVHVLGRRLGRGRGPSTGTDR